MKKFILSMFTLAVLVSCGKEALPADRPKGEAVALTIAPGTKVYELVEELAKYLPEEVQKQFIE